MKRLPIDFVQKMNAYGQMGKPFFFMIDFEMMHPKVYLLEDMPHDIRYSIGQEAPKKTTTDIVLESIPESYEVYRNKFDRVKDSINKGDSYLLNLTSRTPVLTSSNLEDIYETAYAKYKLIYKNQFLCFSPEPFIQIRDNQIYSFPMKGTIDASLPNAQALLSDNPKELAEHYTIVDLIRNDLSRVATHVQVDNFRYTEKIDSPSGSLLQQSTAISGTLDDHWKAQIGDIFNALLPAGSISGAPKQKTIAIIQEAELLPRGYYTGIFGVFDGHALDSGVMIRFIEQDNGQLYFRSGGGITHMSKPEVEYQEMIDKIYVPIFRKHQGSASQTSPAAVSFG